MVRRWIHPHPNGQVCSPENISLEDFSKTMAINVEGPLFLTKEPFFWGEGPIPVELRVEGALTSGHVLVPWLLLAVDRCHPAF
jgi:hypothetical protein